MNPKYDLERCSRCGSGPGIRCHSVMGLFGGTHRERKDSYWYMYHLQVKRKRTGVFYDRRYVS